MLNYVKRLNEIEISFFKIAGFSTVTLKISSGAQRHFIKLSLLTDNSPHRTVFQGSHLQCPSVERLVCSKKVKVNNYFKCFSCLFLGQKTVLKIWPKFIRNLTHVANNPPCPRQARLHWWSSKIYACALPSNCIKIQDGDFMWVIRLHPLLSCLEKSVLPRTVKKCKTEQLCMTLYNSGFLASIPLVLC